MQKIKVLVVPSDRTGVGFFRSTKPHIVLEEQYPDEFHIDIDYQPQLDNEKWLMKYDIIHYHRTLGPFEKLKETLDRIHKLGIVTVMDLDDYWSPGKHHPAYLLIKQAEMDKKILNNIKISKNVITTTPIFAKEIGKYNKNVFVLPNAIDPREKQYTPTPEPSERVRIGWLGGSSHLEDLKILSGVVGRLKSDKLLDRVQFVLCGFDTRGTITIIDQNTGKQTRRPITPMESVWYKYEQIFTNNYTTISEGYKKHLLSFTKDEYHDVANEPYRRVWTKPISTYATNYNLFDVSLAPLEENIFNKVKSQLKVIEAGFHKKAIIAQDFGPYQIDLNHLFLKPQKGGSGVSINDCGNALLVNTKRNKKDWYKNIKRLIKNPDIIDDLSERLHETVVDTYSINAVTAKRRNLYKRLLKNNKISEKKVVKQQ